jgi:hypothetical protein
MNQCCRWVPFTNAITFLVLGFKFEEIFKTENCNGVGVVAKIAISETLFGYRKRISKEDLTFYQSVTLTLSHPLGSQRSHNSRLPFPFLSLSSPCVPDPSRGVGEGASFDGRKKT